MNLQKFNVTKEYITPVPLKIVKGCIPFGMKGTYYKNGPAWRNSLKIKHAFDGDGYLTKIRFNDDVAHYQGRYISSENSRAPKAFGGPLFNGFFIQNKANTSVIKWGNDLVAFYEGGCPLVIDEETLRFKGVFPGYKSGWPFKISGLNSLSGDVVNAHPKIIDDHMIALDLKFTILSTYITFREFDKNKSMVNSVEVKVKGFLYIHDWEVTPSYYIFVKHPLKIEPGDWKKGIALCVKQDLILSSSLIYVIDRKTGKARYYDCGVHNFFISHYVSCVENDNYLELMVLCYDEYPFGAELQPYGFFMKIQIDTQVNTQPRLQRYMDHWWEFPSSSYLVGGYSHPMEGLYKTIEGGGVFGEMIKNIWRGDHILAEPAVDKDGRVICFALDSKEVKTYLYIFEHDELVCQLEFPDPYVPIGLHGVYVNDPALNT